MRQSSVSFMCRICSSVVSSGFPMMAFSLSSKLSLPKGVSMAASIGLDDEEVDEIGNRSSSER